MINSMSNFEPSHKAKPRHNNETHTARANNQRKQDVTRRTARNNSNIAKRFSAIVGKDN